MKIDFESVTQQLLQNFKGGEKYYDVHMVTDELNKIMLGKLIPGASIGMHTHTDNSEIIYIISGVGTVLGGEEIETLHAGNCHYCKKGSSHSLVNNGNEDLNFFAVVTNQ